MRTSRSANDLLLRLLEAASLSPISAEDGARQLRRAARGDALKRRVADALGALAKEGLLEREAGDLDSSYAITAAGIATLEQKGRFPGGAAVLFTDIVASTELIGRYGESGAHELFQRHFALLRKAIQVTSGREVKSLGDGLMVIFGDTAAAVACAVEMQRVVARDRDALGLRVGLHVGGILREGSDFFGQTVIVARRLCDIAEAGQIVLSDEAATRGAGDTPTISLGDVALKGLPAPVGASTLVWASESRTRVA